MKTVSLCMIVKDGEKYIEQCLESVSSVVAEMIIVDTGSTDSTLEKIQRFKPKISKHEWNNNFSEARNVALQQASSDYILLLDADEVLYAEDLPMLTQLLENTKADCMSIRIHNLTDETNESLYNIHEGLRIFKRGTYHYEGAIHEQPVFNFPDRKPVLAYTQIRIKHYGYIKSNSGEKKFQRNMALLNEELAKNPDEPFHLFNMGNQYMSIGDYTTALDYFEKADQKKEITLAYSPHLIFRRAICLKNLKRNDESLRILTEGLKLYPACTDFEFMRGQINTALKRYTLALDCFTHCLNMGQAPVNLLFFPDTWNVRPLIEIAQIYSLMDDHEKALHFYLKALNADGRRYDLIYKVTGVLSKIHTDPGLVYKNLSSMFADSTYKPNVMVMVDAMLDEKLFEPADLALSTYKKSPAAVLDSDVCFLTGRIMYYAKNYQAAYEHLNASIKPEVVKGILPNAKNRAYEYMLVCSLLCSEVGDSFIELLQSKEESLEKAVYLSFLGLVVESLPPAAQAIIVSILVKLLTIKKFDLFEQVLSILNLVDSNEILLSLAEVYYISNYQDMAVGSIIRSIKELDCLNARAVMILNKAFK